MAILNDGSEFERSFKDIYPSELELQKEHNINTENYFLDLGIKIRGNRFFYDKRDDFPFSVARMSYLCSNIHIKIFYSTFGDESFRIARTTSACNEFTTSSKALFNRARKQSDNV